MSQVSEETQTAVTNRRRSLAKGKKAIQKKFATLQKLEIVYVPYHSIKPNSYNPNRQSEHDFELLCRSIEEDGFTQPVLVNDGSKAPEFKDVICDGEHRWRAFEVIYGENGTVPDIPIAYAPFTAAQMKISTIRHNRARGSHDIQLESEMLRDLAQLGALEHAQDSLMLDDVELNRLLNDISAPDAMADLEFSDAWVPDSVSESDRQLIAEGAPVEARTKNQDGTETVIAMSASAVDVQRRREDALSRATTEQDRIQVRKDSKIYRIALAFAGDEAEIVKAVLGSQPAEKLLELCRMAVQGA